MTRSRCASRTGSSTRSSRSPRWPGSSTTRGNYEAATEPGDASCSTTRDCAASRPSGASARTRCSWASASPPSPRCAAWRRRGCSAALDYAAGGWETASIRMLPTGKVEVVTGASAARPGARDGVEPDRRRPAGRAVRGRRGAARRHPDLAQGPGHLRLPVAGRRRHRGGQGGREGHREGQGHRGAPAGGQRGRPRVRARPVHRPGHRPGRGHGRHRVRRVHRAQPARRRRGRRWTPTPPSTRRTSPSRTAPTCARPRSTPRPAR